MPEITVKDFIVDRNFKGAEQQLLNEFRERFAEEYNFSTVYTGSEAMLLELIRRIQTETQIDFTNDMRLHCITFEEESHSMRISYKEQTVQTTVDDMYLEIKLSDNTKSE